MTKKKLILYIAKSLVGISYSSLMFAEQRIVDCLIREGYMTRDGDVLKITDKGKEE